MSTLIFRHSIFTFIGSSCSHESGNSTPVALILYVRGCFYESGDSERRGEQLL
jgi:hypothetical protein